MSSINPIALNIDCNIICRRMLFFLNIFKWFLSKFLLKPFGGYLKTYPGASCCFIARLLNNVRVCFPHLISTYTFFVLLCRNPNNKYHGCHTNYKKISIIQYGCSLKLTSRLDYRIQITEFYNTIVETPKLYHI